MLEELALNYQDITLDRSESRFNIAKGVHDELEKELEDKRTFFDPAYQPLKRNFTIDGEDESLDELEFEEAE